MFQHPLFARAAPLRQGAGRLTGLHEIELPICASRPISAQCCDRKHHANASFRSKVSTAIVILSSAAQAPRPGHYRVEHRAMIGKPRRHRENAMVRCSSGWRFLVLAFGLSGLSADLAGAALADEPAHLEAQAAIAASEAKARCAPALVKAGAVCEVDEFARLGAVAGHDFSYALYEFAPAPDDPLPYRRVVIFEGLPAAMLRPILISGDDPA